MRNTSHSLAIGLALVFGTLAVGCGDDEASSADYCALITSYEADTDAYGGVLDSDNPDPAEVETAFRAIAARVDALEQQAPASIKSDVSAMADATRQLIDLFEKYDWDVAALMASDDLSTIVTLMDSDAISTADERLEQYSEETCGIDTGS